MENSDQRDSNLVFPTTKEIIDVTKYEQIKDSWGSGDHYSIKVEIGINEKKYLKKTNRISTKKTN